VIFLLRLFPNNVVILPGEDVQLQILQHCSHNHLTVLKYVGHYEMWPNIFSTVTLTSLEEDLAWCYVSWVKKALSLLYPLSNNPQKASMLVVLCIELRGRDAKEEIRACDGTRKYAEFDDLACRRRQQGPKTGNFVANLRADIPSILILASSLRSAVATDVIQTYSRVQKR